MSCRSSGGACAVTADCCAGLACLSGRCAAPVTCRNAGEACAVMSDCCSGLACLSGKCGASPNCGGVGTVCSMMNDCCQGVTCPRYGVTCQKGGIGDPCQLKIDCRTGLDCNGLWCTMVCSTDAQCNPPPSTNGVNNCVAVTGGFQCFPYCQSTAGCSIYPGTTCKDGTNVGGFTSKSCST